ncbi:MAG: GGDEF domain-containing response regulator [Deltaproteobacteria bacterium]
MGSELPQRILLIDASRDSLAELEPIVAELGAHVHHARTLADALRYAFKFCYDAILVDAGLGGGTSLAFLEQLSAVQPTAGVLLSGDSLRFSEGFSLGGNLLGSCRKPWDADDMATALRRAVELSRARRAPRAHFPGLRAGFERVLILAGAADYRRIERMTRLWFAPGGLVHASTLEEAVALFGQQSFDLVLTDLCLPDACGLDPVLRVRRVSAQTPIIVLSALEDVALFDQVLQAGAQDVLVKPELDRQSLFRAMWHARQRQRAQSHLLHDALHDELTSLAKRTLLSQRISNALARSRRSGNTFAVMYIDLDHFKRINDNYGHDVGDAVLVAVSQRLKSAVREYDTVARLGGDEFAILLDSLDGAAEVETVAQRVLSSLAPPIRVNERDLEVTASMGISVFPEGGSAAEELLRSADQAMYSAKRAGRNTYSLRPHGALALTSSKPPASSSFAISSAAPAASAFPPSGVAPAGGDYPSATASSAPAPASRSASPATSRSAPPGLPRSAAGSASR